MGSRRQFLQSGLALSSLSLTGLSPLMAQTSRARKPLNILFLGGTGFLGPHTVQYALDRGHQVTLFNRGRSKEGLFPQLESLVGDRDPNINAGLSALEGRKWDCVIDTSAYVPRIAEASASLLAESCEQYLFISTISVYNDFSQIGMTEKAPVGTLEDKTIEKVDGMTYGPLKAYCEQAVERFFDNRATIIRPGLIVGPRDSTDRYTYWPMRVARGGQILAPGTGQDPVQYIDARDLGQFIVHCLEKKFTGTYNATSDASKETMSTMLQSCQQAINPDAEFVWADTDFLTKQQVNPWADMPVWIPSQGELKGISQIDVSRAMTAGLTVRARSETARDTFNWFTENRKSNPNMRAGLAAEREAEVLNAWLATQEETAADIG